MIRTEVSDIVGDRVEYRNDAGELHRDGDLPAREWDNGNKQWYIEGKLHRIDNPAVIGSGEYLMWWLNNRYYFNLDYYSALYLYKGIIFNL